MQALIIHWLDVRVLTKRLDKAIKEELERAGGYDAWRSKGYANEDYTNEIALERPKRRALSKSERVRRCVHNWPQRIAASRSRSSSKREPERYKQYCRLVLEE